MSNRTAVRAPTERGPQVTESDSPGEREHLRDSRLIGHTLLIHMYDRSDRNDPSLA